MTYTELQVTSNFTFLRGASHPEELVEQAALLGYTAISLADRNSFAGIVRAHVAAKKVGIKFIPGCRLDLIDGYSLLAYPTNIYAYTQLSELLSLGNLRAEKGECHLYKADVYTRTTNCRVIMVPPPVINGEFVFDKEFKTAVSEYREAFGRNFYIAASRRYLGDDNKYLFSLARLADELNVPMVATNDVHYHETERRQLQDVLTCIREKCTITEAGFRLHPNAERFLKPEEEMLRLFRHYPEAVENGSLIADACQFTLDSLKYEYPEEITSQGRSPQVELIDLTWKGARERFGENIPGKIIEAIHHEMKFIEEMNYAPYFLTVYDIVRYAREQRILCQGRGSALIPPCVIAWALPLLIPRRSTFSSSDLFLLPGMSRLTSMWILNMNGVRK